jgi:hypothetical protein
MGHRWRGYEHPELYNMINAGPGAQASEPQTSYWQGLSKELAEVDTDLNNKLNSLGSRWEGKAAESAQAGLTPLKEWAGDAQSGANVMKVSSIDQAEFVSDARANMPEPVPVKTPAPSGWDIAAAAGATLLGNPGPALDVVNQANDHEAEEAAKDAAEQKAVQTMTTYESSSTWNRNTLGTFVPPPDVVVSTPPPQGSASAVIITGTNTRSVNSGDPNGSNSGGKSNSQTNSSGFVQSPTVTNSQPSNAGGGGGGGGGGGSVPPPNVGGRVPPTTTTPSDVIAPPINPPGPTPPINNPSPFPPPGTNPNPNPFPPGGGGPLPGFGNNNDFFNGGNNGNNAGDIARRPLPPLKPGLPPIEGFGRGGFGPSAPGGPGGPGGFPGGPGGFGAVDGERAPSQLGRGGVLGAGPGEGNVVRSGPGAAGAAGARGGNGVHGPVGAGGRREDGEEDDEHYSPDYLLEEDDVFGDDRRVAPTVIGE